MGVGSASHCKFKSVVVVVFATLLESKADALLKNQPPSVVRERTEEDEELEDDW